MRIPRRVWHLLTRRSRLDRELDDEVRGVAGELTARTRLTNIRVLLVVFVMAGVWLASAQTPKPARPLRIEQVRGDLHLVSGEGGNVAVYVTDEGVVLVDDMFHRNHEDILTQVRAITDKPLRYVLNTHQHDDHAGGNFRMLPIAEVIAHRNARANLVDIRQPYYEDTPGTPIGLPRVTFSQEIAVHLGGREVRAYHFGRGHTSGDAIVYFPELRVIHTGDLFLARAPAPGAAAAARPRGVNIYVDYAQGGSFIDWSATLDRVLALDFDVVIPGHGPIATKDDLRTFKADLETMRARVAEMIRNGASKADVVTTLEADYGWRATGCPPSPPTAGCLQFQQSDALIAELRTMPAP
jgi:glyoxylase-like metal-dependent hydrolase (beta-lactamase superfamily II)